MIRYRVFKQLQYKGCPIIIRRIGRRIYEYLLIYDGKFYGTYVVDNLKWWELWKWFKKEPRTGKEQNATVHFLTKAAESTIETVKNKNKKDERNIKN
jgi:hypothetical protein